MDRKLAIFGTFFGVTAIIFGAFGAHALKVKLSADQLLSFETGVKYQMYHALFLLILSFNSYVSDKVKKGLFYFVSLGVLFFSGSIYLLSTQSIFGLQLNFLGPITPIGGALLIISWGLLFTYFVKKKI